MKKYIIILSVSFAFLACEKEIKLKASDIKSRIVVNGLFQANDTLRINISESRDILFNNGNELPNILTAKAELFDDENKSLGKFNHEGLGVYYLPNYIPSENKEYTLKVENEGFDAVNSKNRAPKVISVTKIDTIRKGNSMNVDITFKDNSSEENYYGVTVIAIDRYVYEIEPGIFDTSYFFDNVYSCSKDINTVGTAGPEGDICAENLLLTDATFNGSEYTYRVEKFIGSGGITVGDESSKVVGFVVVLKSMSSDLFKYKTSLQKYNEVKDNPFGEPVQVFSNVTDGFGIFAGQSVYTETIFIE